MTQRLIGLFIAAAFILAVAPHSLKASAGYQGDDNWPFKDETNQSYNLSSGARVEVSGINGRVEISPGSGAAQVHIIRTVPTGVQLSVSGVNGPVNVGDIEGPVDVHGVNGKVDIGRAIEHSNISGINGSITISLSTL